MNGRLTVAAPQRHAGRDADCIFFHPYPPHLFLPARHEAPAASTTVGVFAFRSVEQTSLDAAEGRNEEGGERRAKSHVSLTDLTGQGRHRARQRLYFSSSSEIDKCR